MSDTAPIEQLLHAHFDSRYGARDDAKHLATYSPEAYVVVGERAVLAPLADITPWADIPREREPQFLAPSLTAWHPDGETRGVAMVDLREAATGTPLAAALGLVMEADGWRVAWAGLHEGEPLPYAEQRLKALSELAGIHAASALGPLTSLLEVAYRRTHHLPRQRLLALPETRFSCAGTGDCCSHELTIGLDENSVTFLRSINWEQLAPEVGEGPYTEAMPAAAASMVSFTHKLARDRQGRCRFLDDKNRCTIHRLAGRAVFKPCHVFPYRFALTPDGVCVTTNAMCPTARACKGLPMALQEPELRTRLAVADVLTTEHHRLLPGQNVPWETFRTIEGVLLGLLGEEGHPPGIELPSVRQRLWVASRWLEARLSNPEAGIDSLWYAEDPVKLGWLQRKAFDGFVKMFDPCFKDLKDVEQGEELLPEVEEALANWLRSALFSKAYTYPYGLVTGFNYLVLTYLVLERQVARHAARGISAAFWREFFAVVTTGTYPRLLATCHHNAATRLARHSGAPAFGRTLLRISP